jgi:hypothetical protein
MTLLRGATLVLLAIAAGIIVPSSVAAPHAQTLTIQVSEWSMIPSRGLLKPGPTSIKLVNYGLLPHELDIVKTKRWGMKLPISGGRALTRDIAPPLLVRPGQTRSIHVVLQTGSYLFLDNLRGHYALGTAIPIAVVGRL